jgi:hypothetical protein
VRIHRVGPALLCLVMVTSSAACSRPGVDRAGSVPPAEQSGAAAADAASGHGHDHVHGDGADVPPAGDGTEAYRIGYTLRDVQLPREAGEPGRLSFVIENYRGRPQTGFLEEQTKRMHVYVVRDDLAVFRHVHPQMRRDGTWGANLTLPEPGDYRVVAEFMARDEGGNGDFVMLGAPARVPGAWKPAPAPAPTGKASGWGVEAAVEGEVTAGDDEELRLRLSTPDGRVPGLGTYLGTSAHVTGFHVGSGAAVHMHPLGEPMSAANDGVLTFHTQLPRPGDYVLFVQVVVDDFLHTLPVPVTAT